MGSWFKRRFKTYGPEMILDVLEDRIVLDATVDHTAQQNQANVTVSGSSPDVHTNADASGTNAADHTNSSAGLHVILVSDDVKNSDQIVKAKASDATVIVFDSHQDGLTAINAKLSDLVQTSGKKISTIAVLGHGEDGVIEIGTDHISEANLVKFVSAFETLGANLTQNAQIEFFGCSVAAGTNGKALINDIATYTHSTVFASTNDTGGGEGKDWTLEYSSQPGTQMESILDTAVLAQTDVTLVFNNSPFSWTDNPNTYSVNYGDVEANDPDGSRGTETEFWTFTLSAAGYVSIGAQTVDPNNPGAPDYMDPWIVIRSGNTTVASQDDWGGGTRDLNGDGVADVHEWDSRLVNVHLGAGTYTLEVTHYPWGNLQDYGPYQLLGSYRPTTSSAYTPLPFTWDSTHVPPAVQDPEVASRPLWDVSVSEGFATYTYDAHNSFGLVGGGTIQFRLVNTDPDFLQSVAIDLYTGVITFTEAIVPGSGPIPVTVEAYAGSLVADQGFTFTVTTSHYNLPTADSSRFWVDQNTPYFIFDVTGHDPDRHSLSQVQFVVDPDYTVPLQQGTLTAIGTPYFDATDPTEYHQEFKYVPANGYYGLTGFQFTFQTPGGSWKAFATGVNVGATADTYNTRAVQFADLNNDGYLDIIEGNSSELNNYYLNDGHGNFATRSSLGPSTDTMDTRSIAVGDVNRDGWLDIVAGNYSDSDVVYLNKGTDSSGTWLGFKDGVVIPGTSSGQEDAIVLGDFNRDGYLDLVRGNYDIADRIHFNDGAGNFDSGHDITSVTTGNNTTALAAGDLNRDGYLDLVVGKYNGLDLIFLGTGNLGAGPYFQTATTLGGTAATPDDTTSVALGDLNNDGWLDVVTGNDGDNARVYRSSAGTFSTETDLRSNSDSYSVALGDVNRDGFLDVLVSRYDADGRLYTNNGSGGFGNATTLVSLSADTRSIAVGDVDGDGALDVVYGIYNARDRIVHNQGFNAGSSTYHMTSPAEVELNVGLLKYPSFQDSAYAPLYQGGSGAGWQMYDANLNSFASTFAIVTNGSTTAPLSSIQDYYDSYFFGTTVNELQLSFGLPLSVTDHSAGSNEQVALLLGNQAHDAHLYQDVTLPADSSLGANAGVDLHWRMAYQNDYYFINPSAAFDAANQFIAVWVYTPDVNGNKPSGTQPVFITTANTTPIVSSMQEYTAHLPASLVPSSGAKSIRVEFEVMAQNWFFEVAIDDVALVLEKHTAESDPPPDPVEVLASSAANSPNSMTALAAAAPAQLSALSGVSAGLTFTSASLTSASLASTLQATTSSPVVLSDFGTASVDLGLSNPVSTTTSGTLALADFGFSPFVFDAGTSASKPLEPTAAPSVFVSVAGGQDLTIALHDQSAEFNVPDAQDTFGIDVAVLAPVHDYDQVATNNHIPDVWGKDFDSRVALILDPAETSALHVLQVQSTALGLHKEGNFRDLAARLSAGESLAFDMDALRLYDL